MRFYIICMRLTHSVVMLRSRLAFLRDDRVHDVKHADDVRLEGLPTATLHQRIRHELETKILSGEWPPGHRIPFEHELMTQFDCARMTVNKAMAGLVAAGLIERRRKAGSFVAQQRIQSAVLEIPDIEAEITRRGEHYGYELMFRKQRLAMRDDPIVPALSPGQPVLELICRHRAGPQPFALEQRLISLSAVPEAARVDFAMTSPGSWLLDHVPWTEAEHRITAINADHALCGQLGLPKKSACLVVERRTWRAGTTITFVRQSFRADLYHLATRFTPSGRAAE